MPENQNLPNKPPNPPPPSETIPPEPDGNNYPPAIT